MVMNSVSVTVSEQGGARTTFVAIDGLRGVAALAVVLFHIPNFLGETVLPGAYLAVDLFLCISGFVLTHAYADRLRAGMSVAAFMRRRIIRLYPLHILSGLLGLAYIFMLGSEANFQGNGPVCYLFNLLLIPMPIAWDWRADIFPLNFVAWSILIELIASLAFARFVHGLMVRRVLYAVILIAALMLVASAMVYGDLNLGVSFIQFPGALVRALFSFCAGIAIASARGERPASPTLSFPVIALAALVAMALPVQGGMRMACDLIVVLLLFPALVHGAARCQMAGGMRRWADRLGGASYGVYMLQVPMIAFVASLATALGWPPSMGLGLGFMAGLLGMAMLVDRHIDRPLRAWLARATMRGGSGAVGTPAMAP